MPCLVVRRGLDSCYYEFLRVFAAERHLKIVVDRRQGDRRQPQEPLVPSNGSDRRRRQERRGPPPPTWATGDFAVARRDEDEDGPRGGVSIG